MELYVENVALLRRARVPFGPGFNVLTGETGAGKSLLLDALGLAVGLRPPPELLRELAEPIRVDAVFELADWHPAARELERLGFGGEDGQWVLSRELGRSGRGRCRINGRPVSAAELAAAGELLVSIHTQHESHRLLRPAVQLELLDAYAGDEALALRQELGRLYGQWRQAREEREQLARDERRRLQEMDLLRFQIDEIESAGLSEGEEERLQAEYTRLAAARQLRQWLAAALDHLVGSGAGGSGGTDGAGLSALHALGRAQAAVAQAASLDRELSAAVAQLQQAGETLAELARTLRRYWEACEPDPERLAQLEQRLGLIDRLRRKYGQDVSAVLQHLEQARTRLAELAHHEDRLQELEQRLQELEQRYQELAERLAHRREQAARRLAEQVQGELAQLAMPHARFLVRLQKGAPGPAGWDQAEFLFSANPGEQLRPLAHVASGGELSRTMLAVRTVLAEADPVPVLVFDEPDAGLGGRAAQAVGERLARLSRARQVLVVTHLPQVASLADHHLAVTKLEQDGRSSVQVEALNLPGRVQELARMLGGSRITETALRHAEELLRLAQQARGTAASPPAPPA
ncbi:MAG TPA: DNA repair protein RecN [Limnochordales bacterium]